MIHSFVARARVADVAGVDAHAAAGLQHPRPGARASPRGRRRGGSRSSRRARRAAKLRRRTSSTYCEPLLVLQVAEPPERDPLVVAEPVDRDAQELRRAVDDQHPDLAVEDRAAAAGRAGSRCRPSSRSGRRRPSRSPASCSTVEVEVAVPAVVLDRVVVQAERVDGLRDPVLVGDARNPAGQAKTNAAAARRVGDGPAEAGVRREQRRAPAPAGAGPSRTRVASPNSPTSSCASVDARAASPRRLARRESPR